MKEKRFSIQGAQKRWCVVRRGKMSYFSRPEDAVGKSIALGEGASLRVDVSKKGKNMLIITTADRSFRFRHADREEIFSWLQAVSDAVSLGRFDPSQPPPAAATAAVSAAAPSPAAPAVPPAHQPAASSGQAQQPSQPHGGQPPPQYSAAPSPHAATADAPPAHAHPSLTTLGQAPSSLAIGSMTSSTKSVLDPPASLAPPGPGPEPGRPALADGNMSPSMAAMHSRKLRDGEAPPPDVPPLWSDGDWA